MPTAVNFLNHYYHYFVILITSMISLDALILSLPTRNSTIRMRVWRALKEAGCVVLRDGVYVLPAQAASQATLAKIGAEIRAASGFAMNVEINLRAADQASDLRKRFDRSVDYGALVRKAAAARSAMERLGSRRALTTISRVRQTFEQISTIDFYPGEAKVQAAAAVSALERRYTEAFAGGEPRSKTNRIQQLNPTQYRARVWATRKDLWIDRLASAWLIKRFIDRAARFVWIDAPNKRPPRAIGFDFDGAKFTHAGDRVTFEVLLASFGLDTDPGLATIATAVHFLDIGGIPVDDARGMETVLRGIKEKSRNDDALCREAMRVFDLFYAAYSPAQDRTR
jgi:hypothetical protein